jgi:glutamyl-tRNA synthetase
MASTDMTVVRTRFAPSPTGFLHIGGVRTALFCWAYARRFHGTFVLRIEDTDRERSTEEAIQQILDGMEWVGLDHDEGPFYQTKRFDRYKEVIETMLSQGTAYRCYCSKEELDQMRADQMARGEKPRYDGRCRNRADRPTGAPFVVRFKNPLEGEVAVHDTVVFRNAELDDLIIARTDGTPTYNFCVVVDDMDMKITHVIRGDDHLNNTPRQMNMLIALECRPPVYAHLPMILGSDGTKLSKRHGAVSVLQYREDGYLPEALLNYLVRLGWSHGDQEVFTMQQIVELFDIKDVNKSASAFNGEKLAWLNQQHIMHADPARIVAPLRWHLARAGVSTHSDEHLAQIVLAQRERAKTIKEMAANSVFFFKAPEAYDEKAVRKHVTPEVPAVLAELCAGFEILPDWSAAAIQAMVNETAAKRGFSLGKLAQPIRLAVTGGTVSPPIDATLAILGRDESLLRIARAHGHWSARPAPAIPGM